MERCGEGHGSCGAVVELCGLVVGSLGVGVWVGLFGEWFWW
jgi:hypothetical protein